MRIELVTGDDDVVRFPVERRVPPTLELLREIAPDERDALRLVESFDLDLRVHGVRDATDVETAAFISDHVRPEPEDSRRDELDMLLTPWVARAVEACRAAHEAAVVATQAQVRVVEAQSRTSHRLAPMEEQADDLCRTAALLLVQAHIGAEQAEGAARAVGIAMRGEVWTPAETPAGVDPSTAGGRRETKSWWPRVVRRHLCRTRRGSATLNHGGVVPGLLSVARATRYLRTVTAATPSC